MNNRVHLPIIFCLVASAASAGDEFKLMYSESIGPLKIGLAKKDALKNLQPKLKSGPVEEWGADGRFHQEVRSSSEGVSLMFVSETKNGNQKLDTITINYPCRFATAAGIRIGSPYSDVTKAYRSHFNKEESQAGKMFVAGSVYGGLSFQFKAGKVVQIFLGASAE